MVIPTLLLRKLAVAVAHHCSFDAVEAGGSVRLRNGEVADRLQQQLRVLRLHRLLLTHGRHGAPNVAQLSRNLRPRRRSRGGRDDGGRR